MKCSLALMGIPVAMCLYFGSLSAAATPVEPYSSNRRPARWRSWHSGRTSCCDKGDANTTRYTGDLPFSFKCGERSSREWVTIETARIESGDWQADKTRTHTLSWNDARTSDCRAKWN
jgi:hypothetical protein